MPYLNTYDDLVDGHLSEAALDQYANKRHPAARYVIDRQHGGE